MKELLDTKEMDELLSILENLEDEQLAVKLLKEFNDASAGYNVLLKNLNPLIEHAEWKRLCDQSKQRLDSIIKKIRSL